MYYAPMAILYLALWFDNTVHSFISVFLLLIGILQQVLLLLLLSAIVLLIDYVMLCYVMFLATNHRYIRLSPFVSHIQMQVL